MIKHPVSEGEPDHESEGRIRAPETCRSRPPLPDSQTVQTGAPHRPGLWVTIVTHTTAGHIANQLCALLTNCASEGTRTPNLLIRRSGIGPARHLRLRVPRSAVLPARRQV